MKQKKDPSTLVVDLFGGPEILKHHLPISVDAIKKWKKNPWIPAQYHMDILEAAAARGIRLTPRDLIFGR